MNEGRDRTLLWVLLGAMVIQILIMGLLLYEMHVTNDSIRRISSMEGGRIAWERSVNQRLREQDETIHRVIPHVEATLTRVLHQLEQ